MRARARLALAAGALLAPVIAWPALGPRYGGTLRVGVLELPAPTPGVARSADERLIFAMTHATLLAPGADGQPRPELASSWSSAAAGREWVLKLRQPAAFHDGTPVTATDAVRSLRRFLRSRSAAAERLAEGLSGGASFRSGASEELPGLEARGAAAVVLRFDTARPLPLAPLAAPAAAITSGTGAAAGPFAPTATIAGRRASFAAAAMHLRGRPYLDRVELTAVAETALASELQSGRLDLASGGRGGPVAALLLLAIDATSPPFDRAPARAAVAAAVDRANLVRHLVPGGESEALLVPPTLLPVLPGDVTPTAPPPLRAPATLIVSREVPFLVSQRVVAHLSDVGLQVTVQPRAPSRVLDGPPAALRLWLWVPEVPEAGLALRELARLVPAPPEVAKAVAATEAEMDDDRRRALVYRAEAALRGAQVVVPLAAVPVSFRAAPRLLGVRVDAGGRILIEDAWWEP